MKTLLGILAVLTAIVIFIAFSKYFFHKDFFANGTNASKVSINNHSINFLVARDEKTKQKGLSGMNTIAEDEGMAFPFSNADYYAFWMKGMAFPIDMVFMHNKRIVTIFENVPNPRLPSDTLPVYKPYEPSDLVLELHAGESKKLGIKQGDLLNISL